MSPERRTISLVAERAVRYLEGRDDAVASVEIARAVLSTRVSDEGTARRVLEAAFSSDPRLYHDGAGWRSRARPAAGPATARAVDGRPAKARVLLLLDGSRPARGQRFMITSLAALRLEKDEVVSACGGVPSGGKPGAQLRASVQEILEGAVPVLHDPPGALTALEHWFGEPLEGPVSLRLLAQRRLGLGADHDLEALAARLGLSWRDSDDILDQAEVLDECLRMLRRNGESIEDLRSAIDDAPPINWERFDFDRSFLRSIPRVAGTYRFFDAEDNLLYVGKSRNLHDRVASYFREGAPRAARVQRILAQLHRIELDPVGSDLEALLREAALIRREKPRTNVQRKVHVRGGPRMNRLRSILILEPAVKPWALRAYLLRDARLVGNVGVGPRGAGLKRIERILEDHFFGIPQGPTVPEGPEIAVEVVSRWLGANRDRVVAFDPTDLGSGREVVRRLRWFLDQGALHDPEGAPIRTR